MLTHSTYPTSIYANMGLSLHLGCASLSQLPGTGKDGPLHIGTLSGDMTTSSLYNITTCVYE